MCYSTIIKYKSCSIEHMAKNQETVAVSGFLKKEAEKFVGENKPYSYISNFADDAFRRRIEELKGSLK